MAATKRSEIEVTPEMIEAGIYVAGQFLLDAGGEDALRDAVEAIYRAMRGQSRNLHETLMALLAMPVPPSLGAYLGGASPATEELLANKEMG